MLASPEDVIKFLFFRDSRGKTQVHDVSCPNIGLRGSHDCACPFRLAAGTIDSMVGKLRAFFNKIGRSSSFSPTDPTGNPCASSEVKEWLKATSCEQRRARVTPHQAPPVFSDLLRFVAATIRKELSSSHRSFFPSRFALLRDLAFFLVQWFAGDRAGDLGRTLTREVSRLECGALLFNHTLGKSVRQNDGDLIVIPAIPEEVDLCPVRAVDSYVSQCRDNGLDLLDGHLFRPLDASSRSFAVDTPFNSSAATRRLRLHLRHAPFDTSSFTAHGFRAGCAITLLLLDCSPDDVKAHCRWASDRVFSHYTKLHKVSRLETSAETLRRGVVSSPSPSSSSPCDADAAAAFYARLNDSVSVHRAFNVHNAT